MLSVNFSIAMTSPILDILECNKAEDGQPSQPKMYAITSDLVKIWSNSIVISACILLNVLLAVYSSPLGCLARQWLVFLEVHPDVVLYPQWGSQ